MCCLELWSGFMDELRKSLEKDNLEELYEVYLKLESLIQELNGNIKELPPKEEL